nr:Chitinase domain-containing protein 1 [Polyrhizophydium stewartii]
MDPSDPYGRVLGAGSLGSSVFERSLVVADVSAADIAQEHATFAQGLAHHRIFDRTVLAYVTPWNAHGYDVAKTFRGKFTHLAPLWFRFKRQDGRITVEGEHDVDAGWIADVREPSPQGQRALVVPLFQSGLSQDDYAAVLGNPAIAVELVERLVQTVSKHGFDGMVLEMPIPARYVMGIAKKLSASLRSEGKQLIWVIPPRHSYMPYDPFDFGDFANMEPLVDFFSLMTYDFSPYQGAGPNAPLQWIADNVQRICENEDSRHKILMGMNMYGYDYDHTLKRGDAIIGPKIVSVLSSTETHITWDDEAGEHKFQYTDAESHSHTVHYPTLMSIQQRIELANELGVGLSLWEIGQGLDYFYELI